MTDLVALDHLYLPLQQHDCQGFCALEEYGAGRKSECGICVYKAGTGIASGWGGMLSGAPQGRPRLGGTVCRLDTLGSRSD